MAVSSGDYRREVARRIAWLKARAAEGDTIACIELGDRMLEGNGTRKDVAKGFTWMLSAAAAGHSYAQITVAE